MKVKLGLMTALALVTFGVSLNSEATSAQAAKVLHTKTMKKAAYKVSGGYFYKTASLKKRVHKGSNYGRTNFYTYKSATVQKKHGKKAVYYYVENKSGSVKGWVWHKNLVKQPTYAKQLRDVKAVKQIMQGMSQPVQDATLGLFVHMNYKKPYSSNVVGSRSLSNVIFQARLNLDEDNARDVQGVLNLYNLFKGRFIRDENNNLKNAYYNLDDVLHGRLDESKFDALSDVLDAIEVSLEHYEYE